MNRNLNIIDDSVPRLYLFFLWPSIAGMLVTSFYILVDTIFIGRNLGGVGLAALDLSLPVYNVLTAFGYLLGVGSATSHSASLGKRKGAAGHALYLGLFLSLSCVAGGWAFPGEIARLLGAPVEIVPYVRAYVGTLLNFSPFIILSSLLVPLVCNDGEPGLAMWSFVAGGIINILLDIWFMFGLGWGMGGAAYATGIAQIISLVILALHFTSPTCTINIFGRALRFKTAVRIMLNGAPSFIMELSAGAIIYLINCFLLASAGPLGAAAYSVIANISFICVSIYSGIAHALQPLVSINYGARKWRRVANVRNLSILTALALGCVLFLAGQLFPVSIAGLFIKNEPELLAVTAQGIRLYFVGFLPMGINIALCAYFQSMEFFRHAILLSLGRGLVFVLPALAAFPAKFGLQGIWLIIPAAETCTLLLGITLSLMRIKRH